MSLDFVASGAAGALFGAALASSDIYHPSTILAQMKLKDFRMLQIFLVANGSSALVIALAERANLAKCKRRSSSSLGWLGKYDGNVIGGAMIGVAMALTGACPGTLLVQLSAGVPSSRYVFIGAVLGGTLYAAVSKSLRRAGANQNEQTKPPATVPGKLGIDTQVAITAFEALCVAGVMGASTLSSKTETPSLAAPVVGGLLVGAAQMMTLLLTGAPVGVSGGYGDVGEWAWHHLARLSGRDAKDASKISQFIPMTRAIAFGLGMVIGSSSLAQLRPDAIIAERLPITPLRALVGGLVMIFGARLAGGCTSGHGISGLSLLCISSVVTMLSMFLGGVAAAMLI